jgi:hypothetical protein
LSISDNATGSPQTVALAGTGVAVFTLQAVASSVTALIGSTTAQFTLYATASSTFTGTITPVCSSAATCSFSPTSIFAEGTKDETTLTVTNLTASTTNPFNFIVNGMSGSQTSPITLTILFSDYSLSVTPAVYTVPSGGTAPYTLIVTPIYSFNSAVTFTCSNLPVSASCNFSPGTVTPNGSSPSYVALHITTSKTGWLMQRWKPFEGTPPPGWLLGVACLAAFWTLVHLRLRRAAQEGRMLALASVWPKLAILSLVLALGALAGSCRGVVGIGGTPTGSYIITVNGTLVSNTNVVRTTTVDLIVTPPSS